MQTTHSRRQHPTSTKGSPMPAKQTHTRVGGVHPSKPGGKGHKQTPTPELLKKKHK
jgi:hypothetical protein